ncbi:mucin-21-like [Littorina saxatilis]|uniref:Uncharacterized protein n=1 Tax=Littorina saxatilis TaxID=31220 RepID=A0AAN9AXM5_9CAEN
MGGLLRQCALFLFGALIVNGATTPQTPNDVSTPAVNDGVIVDTTAPTWEMNIGSTPVIESIMDMTTPSMTSPSWEMNIESTTVMESTMDMTTPSVTSPSETTISSQPSINTSAASSQTTPNSVSVTPTPASQSNPATGMPLVTSPTPDVTNTNDTGMTPQRDLLSVAQSPFTPDNSVLLVATAPDVMSAGGPLASSPDTTTSAGMAIADTTANTPMMTTVVSATTANDTTVTGNSVMSDNSTTDSNSTAVNTIMPVNDTVTPMNTTSSNSSVVSNTAGSNSTANGEMSANTTSSVSNNTNANLNSSDSIGFNNATDINNNVNSSSNNSNINGTGFTSAIDTTPILQSVQDIVNDFALTTTPSPVPTSTADPCNLGPAQQCTGALIGQLRILLQLSQYMSNVASVVPWMCGSYPRYRNCIVSSASTCNGQRRLNYDMVVSTMDYICSSNGPNAVGQTLPCLKNRNTTSGVAFCGRLASNLAYAQGVCGMSMHYVNCVSKVYELKCSYAAGYAVKNILHRATAPIRSMLQCPSFIIPPTTTTTTSTTMAPPPAPSMPAVPQPQVPQSGVSTSTSAVPSNTTSTSTASASTVSSLQLKCYECDSGDPLGAAYNSRCSVEGEISRTYIRATPCSSPCYSRVNKAPAGSVKRGCATGLEKLFPNGVVPTRGCHRRAGEVWCFCTRNNCNRRDMENFITVELP